MRRGLRWLAIASVAAAGVLTPIYAPRALARVDIFVAEDVDVAGATWVSAAEILRTAGIDGSTNVWEPLDDFEARIAAHPMVMAVNVRRDLPRRLAVEIEERVPVGLVPTPTLEAIDRDGRYLPIDPAGVSIDLPILVPRADPTAEDTRPTRARIRNLARLADAMRRDAVFWSRVSEVREMDDGTIVARWGAPDEIEFQLDAEADLARLREGLTALEEEMRVFGDELPEAVDLRWADQVVVRYGS